jgi:hypothetical protein
VPESELPAELQGLSLAQKEALIAEQTQKRAELARQLAEKARLRDEFIKQKALEAPARKKGEDSFDEAVSRTLKKQITK